MTSTVIKNSRVVEPAFLRVSWKIGFNKTSLNLISHKNFVNWTSFSFTNNKSTVWKNEKFSATQICSVKSIYIVKFFSKTSIWRKICHKTVAVKFHNFHTVPLPVPLNAITIFTGKSTFSVKSTSILKKLLYGLDFTKYFESEHSVENAEILSHTFFAKISWKQWFY